MGGVSVGVMVGETDHLLFYALSLNRLAPYAWYCGRASSRCESR